MIQQKFAPGSLCRTKQIAGYTFSDNRYRTSRFKGSLIIRFPIDKRKVKNLPVSIIRLLHIYTDGRCTRHGSRSSYGSNTINGYCFGSCKRLETCLGCLYTHRSVTGTSSPFFIGNTHKAYMQKTVAVALRRERGYFHLLNHHHQHYEKDGKCRTQYADETDDGLLAQLCQCLFEI